MPEELKSHPSLQKFNSPADLFKSYVSLESMLGKNKVPIPDENAPQEEWDKFYEKLGRPKTPDEYEIKLDGVQANEEFLNNYKQWAHKAGLEQAAGCGVGQALCGVREPVRGQAPAGLHKQGTGGKAKPSQRMGTELRAQREGCRTGIDGSSKRDRWPAGMA